MNSKYFPYTNLHVHTPHSFSFFSSITELIDKAACEGIKVLGINDFDTWEGFKEFGRLCREKKIFPSYGIEIMAISLEDQKKGLLVNDPKNPGRVYLGGKGIPCPPDINKFSVALQDRVRKESRKRMLETLDKLNALLLELEVPFSLSYEEIENTTASGWVRERHIAKTLADKIMKSESPAGLVKKITGREDENVAEDFPLLQQLLRSKLLKAGERAYVRESEGAFLSMDEAKRFFLSLGAIPVYPVLADGAGELTDREKDPEALAEWLFALGYHAVEFIPHRNKVDVLAGYAEALRGRGFIVTAGSEHNSPEPLPLKPVAKDADELPPGLRKIFWEGCCAVTAHQERKTDGSPGFVDKTGGRTNITVEELIEKGESIIRRYAEYDNKR